MSLNRFASLVCFVFVITSGIKAQESSRIYIGLEGGLGLMQQIDQETSEYSSGFRKIGFGGLAFQYNFPNKLSLRLGAHYDRKGGNTAVGYYDFYSSAPYDYTGGNNHLNYISFPLLLRRAVGNKFRFYGEAGPYFALLLSHSIKFRYSVVTYTKHQKELYEPTDMGLSAGFGLLCPPTPKTTTSFSLRVNWGLQNVLAQPIKPNPLIQDLLPEYPADVLRNFSIQLMMAVNIKVKRLD